MIPIIKQQMLTLSVLVGLMGFAGCQHQSIGVVNGVLVSAQKSKLIVSHRDGGGIRSFRLAPGTLITLNGRRASWKDLNRYPSVNVRIKHEGISGVVTEVAAVTQVVSRTANKPLVPAASMRPETNAEATGDRATADGKSHSPKNAASQTQEPDADGLTTFEGEIVSITAEGFLLQAGEERRFVYVPDEASVMILDQHQTQPGQIATVVAEQGDHEYIAHAVVIRLE